MPSKGSPNGDLKKGGRPNVFRLFDSKPSAVSPRPPPSRQRLLETTLPRVFGAGRSVHRADRDGLLRRSGEGGRDERAAMCGLPEDPADLDANRWTGAARPRAVPRCGRLFEPDRRRLLAGSEEASELERFS